MQQNIILTLQKQSIKSKQCFQSIVSSDIFSTIPLVGDRPKGLRFTLKNDSLTLDCFTWQKPGEISLNLHCSMKGRC